MVLQMCWPKKWLACISFGLIFVLFLMNKPKIGWYKKGWPEIFLKKFCPKRTFVQKYFGSETVLQNYKKYKKKERTKWIKFHFRQTSTTSRGQSTKKYLNVSKENIFASMLIEQQQQHNKLKKTTSYMFSTLPPPNFTPSKLLFLWAIFFSVFCLSGTLSWITNRQCQYKNNNHF